jgi:hypothetical protein
LTKGVTAIARYQPRLKEGEDDNTTPLLVAIFQLSGSQYFTDSLKGLDQAVVYITIVPNTARARRLTGLNLGSYGSFDTK